MLEKIGITEEEANSIYEILMKEFEPMDGYQKTNYYGVATFKVKKNGFWQIRLQYDYNKKMINGKGIEIDNFDDYITALVVLESKCKSKSIKRINIRKKQYTKKKTNKIDDF